MIEPDQNKRNKSDIAREQLVPLAQGERPPVVTVAAIVALCLAIANVVPYLLGAKPITGASLVSAALLSLLLLVAAIGMWRNRYWATLGFQAYLTLQIILLALALVTSATWLAVSETSLLIVASGALFWKLVRSMARIQMLQQQIRKP